MNAEQLRKTIDRAISWLLTDQDPSGFWVGWLQSNSCMEAEWIMAMHIMGVQDDPKYKGVVQAILNDQREDGSWEVYYQAPTGDINTTVESYAALRIAGLNPDSEPLARARQWILANGGLGETRVFTRYWLALLGEWPWQHTPALPPEIIFIPKWAPFNLYKFASWARATLLPLTILSAGRPVTPLPPDKRLDELFPNGRDTFNFRLPRKKGLFSWERFFLITDRLLNLYVKAPFHPFRGMAIRQSLEWIVSHQDADGAWGGIQPPWIYSLMALHAAGYGLDHPVVAAGLNGFNLHWSYEKNGGIYLQPSESPIWDTVLSLLALLDCGMPEQSLDAARRAVKYLLAEQVLVGGDWQVFVPNVEPGGWAFEFENDKYPDVDDTAVAVIVLLRLIPHFDDPDLERQIRTAVDKAVAWMLAMQNPAGGWAAFDRDNTSKILTLIPFADFGELLDPPSVDVTAHVVEALGLYGHGLDSPPVARAVAYMRAEQEEDGSWFGRWGVNHIYGTAAVLPALEMVGEDMGKDYIQKGCRWLKKHQNPDGGWGETCGSYMDESLRGKGPSTASQTGWALMALLAAHQPDHDQAIDRGLLYLSETQMDNGTWDEPWYTGTGFPGYGVGERVNLTGKQEELSQGAELARGFMLNYNMYRHYFPLIALGRAREKLHQDRSGTQQ